MLTHKLVFRNDIKALNGTSVAHGNGVLFGVAQRTERTEIGCEHQKILESGWALPARVSRRSTGEDCGLRPAVRLRSLVTPYLRRRLAR
jgi:hypothetical protein